MASQPRDSLSTALQHLRRQAGDPSFRRIAKATSYSHTTVAEAITGSRRVSWDAIEQIVRYLGGDVSEAKQLWLDAREFEEPLPPIQSADTSVPLATETGGKLASRALHHPGTVGGQPADLVEARWDRVQGTWNFFIPPHIATTVMKELVQEEHHDDQV